MPLIGNRNPYLHFNGNPAFCAEKQGTLERSQLLGSQKTVESGKLETSVLNAVQPEGGIMTDKEFNIQDYLNTPTDRRLFLIECVKQDTGDGSLIAAALKDVVEAAGIAEVAEKIGMTEKNLAKALANSASLPFVTTLKVMQVAGVRLKAKKLKKAKKKK